MLSDSLPMPRYSVVVPVYLNEATLATLVDRLGELTRRLKRPLEVVFVVDGSPDASLLVLRRLLDENATFSSQLISLSRNFGSFSAIRAGLAVAEGEFVAIMAADLQEPISLLDDFFAALETGEHDVAVGVRTSRSDPLGSRGSARIFWGLFRRLAQKEIPSGGVDVFACTRQVAGELVRLEESHTSLIGLLFWLGFRRIEVPYEREPRAVGKTTWKFRRKVRYLLDSLFSFTDLPVTALAVVGFVGVLLSITIAIVVLIASATGNITVAGYAPIMLAVAFGTSSILFGLGLIGSYVWRTYENTKGRPSAIPMTHERFEAEKSGQ